jgi:RNA polymerase sigma factor (sigma-70 family)
MHDSEVVAAIAAGDPDGLAEAYDRYAAPLYTYCRSLLREPADAADAVQDTFVIAASKVAGLRDQNRLRPWLYAVARNECHRRLRDKASAALDQVPEMSDESADVSEGAERAELRALLRSAVRGLGASEQDLIQLQLQQELDVAEIAAMLGVSRNHAHALLSRARAQLEISLGALLVARSGRGDCEALGALLQDWDGQLNVLMRKRINRHIERCPACTERKRRELAPALLLGLAPLPIAVMPPGLRSQVLRLVSSDTPDAVAHRASVTQRAVMSGPGGFPKPLDPPKSAWWQARTAQGAAAAAVVVVAAAVLTILALTGAFGTHQGQLSALSHGTSAPGAGTASSGGTAPGNQPAGAGGTGGAGSSGGPGSSAKATASAAARVSPSPAAGGATPVGGSSPSAQPPTHSPAPSHSPSPRHSPSPSHSPAPSASSTTAPPPPPPPGTLGVAPRTIVLSAGSGASLRLTASGGPVSWSITESSGLIGMVSVAPASGRLLAGQSTTVSISVSGVASGQFGSRVQAVAGAAVTAGNGDGACVGCQLIVNPGGIVVSVVIETDVPPSSPPPSSPAPSSSAPSCPPPSSDSPEPETASGCKSAR